MALGIALGIAKIGMGAVNVVAGSQASTQAMRDAARFGQQIANTDFVNQFAAFRAPDKGAKLALDEIRRSAQDSTTRASEGGLRGAIGASGRVQQGMTDAAAKIAAQLDELQLQIDNKFLSEEQKTDIRNKQKNLQLAASRLQGAQAAGAAGSQQAMAGLGQMAGGAFSAIAGGIENSNLYKKDDGKGTFVDDSGTLQNLSKKDVRQDDRIARKYLKGKSNDLSDMKNTERKMDVYNRQNAIDGVTSGAGIQLSKEDADLLNTDFGTPGLTTPLELEELNDVELQSEIINPIPPTNTDVMQGIEQSLFEDDPEAFMLDQSLMSGLGTN